jgi:hypothetical protein
MDLATLSRSFEIEFRLQNAVNDKSIHASLLLSAMAADLAGEILEIASDEPWGCRFEIRFIQTVRHPSVECNQIHSILNEIWGGRPWIKQSLSFSVNVPKQQYEPDIYDHEAVLDFGRKIGEDQIEDMQLMIKLTVESLERLEAAFFSE